MHFDLVSFCFGMLVTCFSVIGYTGYLERKHRSLVLKERLKQSRDPFHWGRVEANQEAFRN